MNTLLHAHFNIFISGLGLLKKDLYSNDYQLQSNAKTEMKKYLSSIISTSFGKDLPTDHLKKNSFDEKCPKPNLCQVDNQTLRDFRSRPSCTIGKGLTFKCKTCHKQMSVEDILNNTIQSLHNMLPNNSQWKN